MLIPGMGENLPYNLQGALSISSQIFPNTAVAMNSLISKTPSNGYVFDSVTNPVDLIGSNNLTMVNSVDVSSSIFCNRVKRVFTEGTTDSFDGDNVMYDDPGSTSWGFLAILDLSTAPTVDNQQIVSKRQSSSLFYQLTYRTSVARLTWQFVNTTSSTVTLSSNHSIKGLRGRQPIYFGVNRNGTARLQLINLSTLVEINTSLVVTNTGLFAIGSNTSNSPNFGIQALYYFEGAEAEGWSTDTLNKFWHGAKV